MELLPSSVFDTNLTPMAVLDEQGTLILVNNSFHDLMIFTPDQLENANLLELEHKLPGKTCLDSQLKTALLHGRDFSSSMFTTDTAQEKNAIPSPSISFARM